jgi:polysaccharide deacetylase family protein (PEP-CTERM system associated)
MSHTMLTELSPEGFRAEARDSKQLLEDLAGTPVIGFRAPSYSVGEGTLWALEVLAETGYAYDSSIYPIRRRRYGYPAGPTTPARMAAGARGTLAEFPLPTIPVGPVRLPVLAGAYLRLLPSWASVAATRWHARHRVPLVANVHPWEIDPDQPVIGPSRLSTWTHYARLDRTAGILRAILACGRFDTVATRLRELGLLDGTPSAAATGAR